MDIIQTIIFIASAYLTAKTIYAAIKIAANKHGIVGIRSHYIIRKNLKACNYIDANGLPELRQYFSRQEQTQLFTAWLLANSKIADRKRSKRCKAILHSANQFMHLHDEGEAPASFTIYVATP